MRTARKLDIAQVYKRNYNPAMLFGHGESGFVDPFPFRLDKVFTTDVGSTNVSATNDPIGRIERLAGSFNLTQDVSGSRPVIEQVTSGGKQFWLPKFDGTDDYLKTGVQSFGTASLFADAGQAWTVMGAMRTTTNGINTMIAKASATEATRTLQFLSVGASGVLLYCRGAQTLLGGGSVRWDDGVFHTFILRWTGSVLSLLVDGGTLYSPSVGAASEESQDILIGARTASSLSAYYSGHLGISMVDRAISDAERTMVMRYLNNTYRFGL